MVSRYSTRLKPHDFGNLHLWIEDNHILPHCMKIGHCCTVSYLNRLKIHNNLNYQREQEEGHWKMYFYNFFGILLFSNIFM